MQLHGVDSVLCANPRASPYAPQRISGQWSRRTTRPARSRGPEHARLERQRAPHIGGWKCPHGQPRIVATLESVPDPIFVHYAAGPLVGEWVLSWADLPDALKAAAGHFGKIHDARRDGQYHPDVVYIHALPSGYERRADLVIGAGYAAESTWVYEVDPDPPIGLDPERDGHLATSRTCRRARVLRCLQGPSRDDLVVAIRGTTGRGARAEAARLLLAGHRIGELTTDDLRDWVPDTWTYLSPPSGAHGVLSDAEWLELFRTMGYLMASPEVDLGSEPYMIFRAAPAERTHSMSWCTHEAMARSFLPRHRMYGRYRLWRAKVGSSGVLAVLNRPDDSWRAGVTAREVVVDPAALVEVTELEE